MSRQIIKITTNYTIDTSEVHKETPTVEIGFFFFFFFQSLEYKKRYTNNPDNLLM